MEITSRSAASILLTGRGTGTYVRERLDGRTWGQPLPNRTAMNKNTNSHPRFHSFLNW